MDFPLSISGQLQNLMMVLQEGRAMTDAHQNRLRLFGASVEHLFIGAVEGAGRFIEHRIPRFGDKNAGERQSLLFAD